MLLVLAIILAYILFRNPTIQDFISHLGTLNYLGIFIAGMLFAFGFTAPFSVGFFISLNPSNIWIAGIIGGLGALISDLIIFSTIKISFEDEFKRLRNSKIVVKLTRLIERNLTKKIKVYLMYAFAGILIASPLPDEAGITMLAGFTKIKVKALAVISYVLNTIGILVILFIGRAL
jgi:uncharacterized membrane protein YdjX (TVP38/TMEM64 family)